MSLKARVLRTEVLVLKQKMATTDITVSAGFFNTVFQQLRTRTKHSDPREVRNKQKKNTITADLSGFAGKRALDCEYTVDNE